MRASSLIRVARERAEPIVKKLDFVAPAVARATLGVLFVSTSWGKGLGSRLAAVPLMVSMLVAILTAQREQVHGLPDLFGLVEWTYFALLLWVALAGPGKLSLDHVLFRTHKAGARMNEHPVPTQLEITSI